MLILRKILFYIFAAIYLVLCPLLILYALGFIYDPGSTRGIVKTGLIYVATIPPKADIYLNGKQVDPSSPATLQELLPGNYNVKITLDGYQSWEQTVPVIAEEATVLDSIILIPTSWQFTDVLDRPVKNIIAVPGLNILLLVKGQSISEVDILSLVTGKTFKMEEFVPDFKEASHNGFYGVPGSSSFIVQMVHQGKEEFFWVNIKGTEPSAKSISQLFPSIPQAIMWDPAINETIFTYQKGSVNKLDVEEGSIIPDFLSEVRGFGVGGSKVYLLKADNSLVEMGYDKSGEKVLLQDKDIGQKIFGEPGFFRITPLWGEILLFLGPGGALEANKLPYKFVDKGVLGVTPYPDKQKVLILKKDRIGILDFSKEKTGDIAFEQGPALTWVCTKGKDNIQAFWVYKGSHVLVQDGNKVMLHEIEDYGEVKVNELFEVKANTDMYYSDDSGKLYFVEKGTSRLKSVDIIPDTGSLTESFDKFQKEMKKEKVRELEKDALPVKD